MKCTICGKEVVLVPSAKERARKHGQPASFYTQLFPTHAECELKKRAEDVSELIRKTRRK